MSSPLRLTTADVFMVKTEGTVPPPPRKQSMNETLCVKPNTTKLLYKIELYYS